MVIEKDLIPNQIAGTEQTTTDTIPKVDPHRGALLWAAARSRKADVNLAVAAAHEAQIAWADTPGVARGVALHRFCNLLESRSDLIAATVAAETGKAPKEAAGETSGAIALGRFFAGEGQRLYGRTTTSAIPNRYAMTLRRPVGVAGLITAANTPIANVAWKVFPALICGNAAVLKAPEDAPGTAWLFAEIAAEAGLPPGVLNVIQGYGPEAGALLVAHEHVDLISFTGSTKVGREIAEVAARRLAKVSLELGGKNPLVVCDDADLDNAIHWAILSAFSNAGQRCASGSRLIVFDEIYEEFKDRFVTRTSQLRLGPTDSDDLGPVINESALDDILAAIERGVAQGAKVLCGGTRVTDESHKDGYYIAPTVIEGAEVGTELVDDELFGPVTALFRAKNFDEAISAANSSRYGLTAAIHTKNWDRAMEFCMRVRAGVAGVNTGTFGSEPHMPFGGIGASGNGTREPGTEALDVYSDLKDLYLVVDPNGL